jgi:hypothetical protein
MIAVRKRVCDVFVCSLKRDCECVCLRVVFETENWI